MDKNFENWLNQVVKRISDIQKRDADGLKKFNTSVQNKDFVPLAEFKRDNILDLNEGLVAFTTSTMAEEDLEDVLPSHNFVVFQYIGNADINDHYRRFVVDENSLVKYYNSYCFNLAYSELESVNKAAHYCVDRFYEWIKRNFQDIY